MNHNEREEGAAGSGFAPGESSPTPRIQSHSTLLDKDALYRKFVDDFDEDDMNT